MHTEGPICVTEAEARRTFSRTRRGFAGHRTANVPEKLFDNPNVWNYSIDPVTRSSGNLVVNAVIDFEAGRVLDAQVENPQAYGAELILKNRRPSDAVQIAARIRGASSASHSIAASLALEMAGGITPPPLAIISRNLGSCGEIISETIRHLFIHAGPDYSEEVVSKTTPALWRKAQKSDAPGLKVHGLETVADIMRGLNPMSGHLYLEALQMLRLANEITTLIFGKSPHASTLFPGGIGIEANREAYNQILGRVNSLLDYAKKGCRDLGRFGRVLLRGGTQISPGRRTARQSDQRRSLGSSGRL
ncbi:MAG: nickel-dependent hydrogenase large subunit [Acidobacteria bacterium]|nr:nickel-dependent hydrogenase large subunit [Acidobacteriota bacterium]